MLCHHNSLSKLDCSEQEHVERGEEDQQDDRTRPEKNEEDSILIYWNIWWNFEHCIAGDRDGSKTEMDDLQNIENSTKKPSRQSSCSENDILFCSEN